MPYIKRDEKNKIKSYSKWDEIDGGESVSESDEELKDFLNQENDYSPENTMDYIEKRNQNMANGGYGTWREQLEMMNEEGFVAWQVNCQAVKNRFPKP